MPSKLSLSEHTLDINTRKCDLGLFDFSEVEDYVRLLTGDREYQFKAIKQILIYLWGGVYKDLTDLAKENYRKKEAIRNRFQSEDHFLRLLPLPDRLSGVCHLATGTGKSYVMFAVAHLTLLLDKVSRVLILGPSSTVIESGLREKFKEYLYGEKGAELKSRLPERLRHKVIRLLNCNDPIEDQSIVIENINAIYNRGRNSLGDTLFNSRKEILVLSDEVHHAYSHLAFSGEAISYNFREGEEGRGEDRDERLWMKYIREELLIKRHIGFTGTPYNKDQYFPDVICNYSIKDAVDEKIIKKINPILKLETEEGDDELTPQQRFEQILITHRENKKKYAYLDKKGRPQVKPITIFIHPTQTAAQKNAEAFIQALADDFRNYDLNLKDLARAALEQTAREKVICVLSRLGETEYQQKLDQIEQIDPEQVGGKVEFIFAVNKLSEGWDVDNVFQIVPSEQRVFNSKLLISQVIGRGLRLPRNVSLTDIAGNYPVVTITNHEKFAQHIQELLDEVTQCELRFISETFKSIDQKRYDRNFHLFNLEYLPVQRLEDRTGEELSVDPTPRELTLEPFSETLGVRVVYREGTKRFELSKELFTVDQIVFDVERRFKNTIFESRHFDFGDGLVIEEVPGREEIEQVIRQAMKKKAIEGERLSRKNRQQIDIFFNQFLPKGKKKVIRENIEGAVLGINTEGMPGKSTRSGGLDHEITVFLSEDYENELKDQNLFVLQMLMNQDRQLTFRGDWLQSQEDYNREYIRQMLPFKNLYAVNTSLFKTPQDLVIVSHEPERKFIFRLIEHSKWISSWIKSPDRDFYSLEYEYWKGEKDRVRRPFNPDFFIRIKLSEYLTRMGGNAEPQALHRLRSYQDKGIEELILVVEIKDDEDNSAESRAKEEFGKDHFQALNSRLRETNPIDLSEIFRASIWQQYFFFLLRPKDYPAWFAKIQNGLIALG